MIIDSRRIILRNWQDKDIDDLVEGLNNINVLRWMAGIPFHYTKNDAKDFIDYAKNLDEEFKMAFAIVLKETNKVIGRTEITNL